MTNLPPKKRPTGRKRLGIITLLTSIILLVTTTLLVMFAAKSSVMQQKITSNQYNNEQAADAAQAGLEYAITYLQQNKSTIIASAVSGLINYTNSTLQNVALANGSKYSIVYTNPTASNYDLIKASITGTDAAGVASKTITQNMQLVSLLSTAPTQPLVTKGNLTLSGNTTIINAESNNTITSAGTISISGNAKTQPQTGLGSDKSNIRSDVQQNASSLQDMSQADFFASYFGATPSTVQSEVQYYYSNSSNTDYTSQLNGKTGSIWIDQTGGTASIGGSATIGTATNPVLLIVNGNVNFSGNLVVYGLIYIQGATSTISFSGNMALIGGIITASDTSSTTTTAGNSTITYSSSVLTNLKNTTRTTYAKVPGSWKDF